MQRYSTAILTLYDGLAPVTPEGNASSLLVIPLMLPQANYVRTYDSDCSRTFWDNTILWQLFINLSSSHEHLILQTIVNISYNATQQ